MHRSVFCLWTCIGGSAPDFLNELVAAGVGYLGHRKINRAEQDTVGGFDVDLPLSGFDMSLKGKSAVAALPSAGYIISHPIGRLPLLLFGEILIPFMKNFRFKSCRRKY